MELLFEGEIYVDNSWWLVLGWVTTKEYHSRLSIANCDLMARYKCRYHIMYHVTVLSAVLKLF